MRISYIRIRNSLYGNALYKALYGISYIRPYIRNSHIRNFVFIYKKFSYKAYIRKCQYKNLKPYMEPYIRSDNYR